MTHTHTHHNNPRPLPGLQVYTVSICRPFPLTPKDREDTLKWLSGRGRGEREVRGRGVIADSGEKGWMEEVYTHMHIQHNNVCLCFHTQV